MSRWPIDLPAVRALAPLHLMRWMPWRRTRDLVLMEDGLWDPGAEQLHADVPGWCEQHPGCSIDLWVAGPLMHQLVCKQDVPLTDLAMVSGYARQLFTHYHGLAAQQWEFAPWRSGRTRGASALHGPALGTLRAAAEQCGVLVHSTRPLWSAALRSALLLAPSLQYEPCARVVLAERDQLTWITLRLGHCNDLFTTRLTSATAAALAQALTAQPIEGEAPGVVLGYGIDGELPALHGYTSVGGLDGAGPPASWLTHRASSTVVGALPLPRFEPGGARQRPPVLAWASLGCAAAVFAAAAVQAHADWQAREAALALMDTSLAEPLVLDSAVERTAGDVPAEADEAARVAAAMALRRPWGHWLAAVELAGGGRVKWRELEHDAAAGDAWRLRGSADDTANVLATASSLAGQPGWHEARVTRLQEGDAGAALTFELAGLTQSFKAAAP